MAFGLLQPVFFHLSVLFDAATIVGEIGIMALAMTLIITTGGIDLSVGYILELSAIVFGVTLKRTGNLAEAIVASLAAGTACGLLNGFIISRTKIPPLVTTLATMNLYRGLSFIIAGTSSYTGFPAGFKLISTYLVLQTVPVQLLYFVALFVLFQVVYARGSLGRSLKGIGFNEGVLIFSGIKTKNILLWIYTLCGLMSAVAALVYLGRLSAAKTSMGDGLNLQVITAVVLGGTSIMGGVGSILGTFFGVLLIGVLRKGFTLVNLGGNVFNFTLGLILILALVVFAVLERRKAMSSRLPSAEKAATEKAAADRGAAKAPLA